MLNAFGGKLEKISFMKLLLLFCESDKTRQYYEFVPYRLGAFSFTSYSDMNGLEKDGVIYKDKKILHYDNLINNFTK